MLKKSITLSSHGRVIQKPNRYCTTESSADERPAASNPPKKQMSMEQRIAMMVDQVASGDSQHFELGSDQDDPDEIMPNSQLHSSNSVTFSDVVRVTTQGHNHVKERINHIPLNSRASVNLRPVSVTGTVEENRDITPTTSSEQTLQRIAQSTTDGLQDLLQQFEERQKECLLDFAMKVRKDHREDMIKLNDHAEKRYQHFETVIKQMIQKEREIERAYPYEKPPGFPLDSLEVFQEFEEDPERQRSLKHYLINVGGITARDALNQFLKEAMTDSLTKHFSWTGKTVLDKENLRPLFNTCIGKVFFDALRECRTIPQPRDRTKFARLMQEVIRGAKQRLRDSKRRANGPFSMEGRRQKYMNEMAQRYDVEDPA
ncbi:uncharacterized protein LOC124404707 [Diprion similis]|uniref:uncharacterized protein LOC124404707 n=1 Tax=Diprion similis TaxID=362088 RepID=UPI001EF8129A|nr:uncharacterized protein LOC124404707 [Diprion similis]